VPVGRMVVPDWSIVVPDWGIVCMFPPFGIAPEEIIIVVGIVPDSVIVDGAFIPGVVVWFMCSFL
jgi:hypothetical protein